MNTLYQGRFHQVFEVNTLKQNKNLLTKLSSCDNKLEISEDVNLHYQGQSCSVNSWWQRQKYQELILPFVGGITHENEAYDKTLEIRKLAPSKEKRISPDGNCLFRSLSYILSGSDHYLNKIRVLLLQNMKN